MIIPVELQLAAGLALVVAGCCWLLSVVFDEYSWVDRIWSIVPPIYVGTFAAQADFADARLTTMTALTVLWGARLTFNYARKGGYARGGEDYRWGILKARMPRAVWHLFNVGFIAGYQNLLLLLIALPAWTAFKHRTPLRVWDAVAASLFVLFLIGEFIADQQQWDFHQQKKRRAAAGESEAKGFVDGGLWAWSRHPNFFCELGQWWMVYLFAVSAAGSVVLPTLVGPVLLTLLFDGSTRFTESITAKKYPAYAAYQRNVSRWLPLPPQRAAAQESAAAE